MSEKPCTCKDCLAAAERKNKHENHWFYKTARAVWLSVQNKQIQKGAEKYPNPFDPGEWSNDELANHALEENVDQAHYIVGMKQRMNEQEKRILQLEKELAELKIENKTLRGEF